MNADSYFEIGSTHLVCQDYALSGLYKDMCYGIVSDGCSSAENSEIGAQILCHGARYSSLKDMINATEFQIDVDRKTYNHYSIGDVVFKDFRKGSALTEGSLSSWLVKVKDKRTNIL